MDEMERKTALARKLLDEALGTIFRENETGVIGSWVVVADGLDGDGARVHLSVASDGCATWQRIGLLRFQLASEENNVE